MAEKALADIVGSNNVLADHPVLTEFQGASGISQAFEPRCIVRPASTEEVRQIVAWANETSTPLIPVSSGPPHRRGDTAPGAPGGVMLDLSKMKRIIRIDAKNRIAMVEPGVTFGELQSALAGHGMRAYLPLGPRTTKSVVASILEREPITRPSLHWDSTDPLLCAEVVFGSGDRFRTGEASGPETIEEQWEMDRVQMNPFGHSHVDFQRFLSGAQGTIGVVTWATLKCSPLPVVTKALFVPSPDLTPLLDLVYGVVRSRFAGSHFIVNGVNLAALLATDTAEAGSLARTLPSWVLVSTFEGYGILPEERVAWEEAEYLSMTRAVHLEPDAALSQDCSERLYRILSQLSDPSWRLKAKGGFQELFFLTTIDRMSEFAAAMNDLAIAQGYPAGDVGCYIQPVVQGTSCHCEFDFYFDPEDRSRADAATEMVKLGASRMAALGGFFSRPYPLWKETAYRDAKGTAEMQKRIKAIFDPNSILNPGKLCF